MTLTRALAIALACQLVLAAVTWWPEDPDAHRSHPLLDISRDAIDRIGIVQHGDGGEDRDGLVLLREAGEWRIASAHGYPADPAKVTALIDRLSGLAVRAPIATSPSSHNSLEVGERDHGRRITVGAGEAEVELVIGAASSNRINVRIAEQDEVYVASGASEWSFSDAPRSYWPSHYVNAALDGLASISVRNEHGTLGFERSESGWILDAMPEGRRLDEQAVETLLAGLVRLPMGEVVSDAALPEHGLESGAIVIWTEASEIESVVGGYAIGLADASDRFVKADGQTHVVKIPETTLAAVLDAKRLDLLVPPEALPAPESVERP